MPSNLKLNDELIAKALEVGPHKTKQAAVNAALAEYVERRNRLRILDLGGKIKFRKDWDHRELRRDRR